MVKKPPTKDPHAVALGRKAAATMTDDHRRARAKKAARARWSAAKQSHTIGPQLSTEADDVAQAQRDLLRTYQIYAPKLFRELSDSDGSHNEQCRLLEKWGLTRDKEAPAWVLNQTLRSIQQPHERDPSVLPPMGGWSGLEEPKICDKCHQVIVSGLGVIEFRTEWHPKFLENLASFRKKTIDQFEKTFDRRVREIEKQYRSTGLGVDSPRQPAPAARPRLPSAPPSAESSRDGLRQPDLIPWSYFKPAVLFQTFEASRGLDSAAGDIARLVARECVISRSQVYLAHQKVFERVGLTPRRYR
jgi:hypothetical protein